MKELFKKPKVYWLGGIFLGYLIIDVLVSGFYNVLLQIPYFLETINWSRLILSISLAMIIAFLVAMNMLLLYQAIKEKQKIKREGIVSSLGMVSGLAAGVCPACVLGLFPIIFSLFGLTFTWTFLPWEGTEIQVVTILLLATSIILLTRKKICKVKK